MQLQGSSLADSVEFTLPKYVALRACRSHTPPRRGCRTANTSTGTAVDAQEVGVFKAPRLHAKQWRTMPGRFVKFVRATSTPSYNRIILLRLLVCVPEKSGCFQNKQYCKSSLQNTWYSMFQPYLQYSTFCDT